MKKTLRLLATASSVALLVAGVSPALAQMSAADVERLGKDLTPSGAERAGNKEGTIPAWEGGLTEPPAGWKPEQGYIDPFKDEKPRLVINAQNVEEHADKLSAGTVAMIKKFPTFHVNVYPTHRTFANPQEIYDATKAQAGKVKLEGLSIKDYALPGVPFPVPQSGVEVMYNHMTRYYGGGKYCRDWLPVRASGDYYRVGVCEDQNMGQNMEPSRENNLYAHVVFYDAPATLVGTIYLLQEPLDYTVEPRAAWIYNAGQRRVRRAPDLAFDNVEDGNEGMGTTDDYWGHSGALDRYDYTLIGKKEIYIPYNAYKLQDPKLKYADMVDKGTLKADLQRYELHRVYVVEATLKKGMSHVLPKRVFYVDEDSHMIALIDGYDGRGNLWRSYAYHLVQGYDAGVMFQAPFINTDLLNGNFLVRAISNERKTPVYQWNQKGRQADFEVDAIRRRGAR